MALAIPLFFVGGFSLIFVYIKFVGGPKVDAYQQAAIRGRVQQIISFSRGIPTVRFYQQAQPVTLDGPSAFGRYVTAGDSIVKPAGRLDISVYRKREQQLEVTTWRYREVNGYKQVQTERRHIQLK